MRVFSGLLVCAVFAPAMPCETVRAADRLPNVVYVMADDLGIGDVHCFGKELCRT
ncbi:MAG: arylsulfatase, partial [Planctomycetes bacterium]|nr:arylsulfatase [Planctomycetota bacterium]